VLAELLWIKLLWDCFSFSL